MRYNDLKKDPRTITQEELDILLKPADNENLMETFTDEQLKASDEKDKELHNSPKYKKMLDQILKHHTRIMKQKD